MYWPERQVHAGSQPLNPDCPKCNIPPALGIKKLAVLKVDLPDRIHDTGNVNFTSLFNDFRKFYEQNSYNKMSWNVTLSREWYLLPFDFQHYVQRPSTYRDSGLATIDFISDSLTASSGEFDFNRYDAVMILSSSFASQTVPAKDWEVGGKVFHFPVSIVVMHQFSTLPVQPDRTETFESFARSTIEHEAGHLLGLPDLYSTFWGSSLFTWDKVPGEHENRVLDLLKDNSELEFKYGSEHYKNSTFSKEGNVITISNPRYNVTLTLRTGGFEVRYAMDLALNGDTIRGFPVKEENGMINIHPEARRWSGYWDGMAGSKSYGHMAPLSGWSKYKLGWIGDDYVFSVLPGHKAQLELIPIGLTPKNVSLVKLPVTETSYYLIERRELVGADTTLWEYARFGVLLMFVEEQNTGGRFGEPVIRWINSETKEPATQIEEDRSAAFQADQSFSAPDFGSMKIVINPDGLYLVEIDRTQVQLNLEVPVAETNGPDLAAIDIIWDNKSPVAGDSVTFTYTVANIGDVTAGYHHVSVWIDNDYLWHSRGIPLESSEQRVGVTRSWTCYGGVHEVKLDIDSGGGLVKEVDESNNILKKQLSCNSNIPPSDAVKPDVEVTVNEPEQVEIPNEQLINELLSANERADMYKLLADKWAPPAKDIFYDPIFDYVFVELAKGSFSVFLPEKVSLVLDYYEMAQKREEEFESKRTTSWFSTEMSEEERKYVNDRFDDYYCYLKTDYSPDVQFEDRLTSGLCASTFPFGSQIDQVFGEMAGLAKKEANYRGYYWTTGEYFYIGDYPVLTGRWPSEEEATNALMEQTGKVQELQKILDFINSKLGQARTEEYNQLMVWTKDFLEYEIRYLSAAG